MPRPRVAYSCTACGAETSRWEGRCPRCESWGSLVEITTESNGLAPGITGDAPAPAALTTLMERAAAQPSRITVGAMPELMTVLGGGVVPGSVTLLGGEPGIGKSTLLLQIASALGAAGANVVYVAGEESPEQIALRAARLSLAGDGVTLVSETNVDALLHSLNGIPPGLLLVDSIQTLRTDATSSAGSIAQVRECGARLVEWGRRRGVSIIMTGHVTKDGAIAGPRVLEHAVDVVLYLEGEGLGPYRVARCVKNRFGSTDEIAVLEMTDSGLREVDDPSAALTQERTSTAPGSIVTPIVEGTRPLLVEIQALVAPSGGADPRRMATGVDLNRLLLICAVLSRRLRLPLGKHDVIVNAIGGLRVTSPSADLAIALAIVSSLRDVPAAPDLAAVGEIGLTGDVRRVPQLQRRIGEAARRGYSRIITPADSATTSHATIGVIPVSTLHEAVEQALSSYPERDNIEPMFSSGDG